MIKMMANPALTPITIHFQLSLLLVGSNDFSFGDFVGSEP